MNHSIPDQALVVVADGGKALLLRRTGTGPAVSLREESRLDAKSLAAQGPAGARPDQSPKQTGEATFVNELAHHLLTMRQQNRFEALVLVADPQTLGQLRSAIHKTVEQAVAFSISKDLTNHPLKAIESALTE